MKSGLEKKDVLSTWKDIANYLGCSVRTCRRWEEEYGLPIKRVGENSGTTVYAFKDELENWLQKRKEIRESSTLDFFRQKRGYFYFSFIVLAAFALIFLFVRSKPDPQPTDFKINRSTLTIVNKEGSELWSFDTGRENLMTEEYYILFPLNDITLLEALMEPIIQIYVLNNGRLQLRTGLSNIFYELSFGLELLDVKLGHGFIIKYREALRQGKLVKELDQAEYVEKLSKGFLYWDGRDWGSSPTMNAYWKSERLKR